MLQPRLLAVGVSYRDQLHVKQQVRVRRHVRRRAGRAIPVHRSDVELHALALAEPEQQHVPPLDDFAAADGEGEGMPARARGVEAAARRCEAARVVDQQLVAHLWERGAVAGLQLVNDPGRDGLELYRGGDAHTHTDERERGACVKNLKNLKSKALSFKEATVSQVTRHWKRWGFLSSRSGRSASLR